MRYQLMLVILLVLVSLAEQPARTSSAQGTTYTDPFAYCAAVGTIDSPDARYVGPKVPDVVVHGLHTAMHRQPEDPPDWFRAGTSWRCMEGTIYACSVGTNQPSQQQANSNTGSLPGSMTSRAAVYTWRCQNGVAAPGRQHMQVDARGFLANIWHAISPRNGAAPTMPRTGGTGSVGHRTLLLAALGGMGTLLGPVLRRRLVVA